MPREAFAVSPGKMLAESAVTLGTHWCAQMVGRSRLHGALARCRAEQAVAPPRSYPARRCSHPDRSFLASHRNWRRRSFWSLRDL